MADDPLHALLVHADTWVKEVDLAEIEIRMLAHGIRMEIQRGTPTGTADVYLTGRGLSDTMPLLQTPYDWGPIKAPAKEAPWGKRSRHKLVIPTGKGKGRVKK
jgi:hypothetical protein